MTRLSIGHTVLHCMWAQKPMWHPPSPILLLLRRVGQIYCEVTIRNSLNMLSFSARQEIPSILRNPTMIHTKVHFRNKSLIRVWISFLQAWREKASFPFHTSHVRTSIRLPQQYLIPTERLHPHYLVIGGGDIFIV